jgi:tRNA-dihydrouridine synthase B
MKLPFKNKFLLAPMLEPNDIAFRLLCKKAGAGLTYTGMTNPLSRKKLNLQDKPALQLFSSDEKGIKAFIKKYDKKVSMWDFNLGCPSKLSKKLGHGAFLTNLKKIRKILETIRTSTKKPCSIKLRKSDNAIEIAKLAEKLNFNLIAIHPRTIKQGYSGEPDYNFALQLKSKINIPIAYSGNVNLRNYKKILEDFDFVMLGREAIGNAQIFSEIQHKKTKITFKDYRTMAKKHKLPWKQLKFQAMCFTKKERNAKELRRNLIKIKTLKELEKVFN